MVRHPATVYIQLVKIRRQTKQPMPFKIGPLGDVWGHGFNRAANTLHVAMSEAFPALLPRLP